MATTIELFADFETTTTKLMQGYKNLREQEKKLLDFNYPKVYCWGFIVENKYLKYFKNIEPINFESKTRDEYTFYFGANIFTFIYLINNIKLDTNVIFHNMGKFDGHFILPALSQLGYKNYRSNLANEERMIDYLKYYELNDKNEYEIKEHIKRYWKQILPNEISELTSENSLIYTIKMGTTWKKWSKGKYKYRIVNFLDNNLLFKGSIKKFGETLAKIAIKEGMDEKTAQAKFHKKDLDYFVEEALPFEELKKQILTIDYQEQDCFILYQIRKLFEKTLDKKYWHMTTASTAYHEFLRTTGEPLFKSMLDNGNIKKVEFSRGLVKYKLESWTTKALYNYQLKEHLAKSLIPVKWQNWMLNDEKAKFNIDKKSDYYIAMKAGNFLNQKFYYGGISWVNEIYRGRFIEKVKFYDRKSSFPASMNSDDLFPVGVPDFWDNPDKPYKLYQITAVSRLENKNGLPFVFTENQARREYQKIIEPGQVFHLDTHAYKRFLQYYVDDNSKFESIVVASFDAVPGKNIFGPYINKWFALKELAKKENDLILSEICKVMLNALYGKFGSKNIRDFKVWNTEYLHWDKDFEELNAKFYLPWAICITSLARMSLVDVVGVHNKWVIGGDTDSTAWNMEGYEEFKDHLAKFVKNELGYYECENPDFYYSGVFRRSKQYIYYNRIAELLDLPKARKLAYAGINLDREFEDEYSVNDIIYKDMVKFRNDLTYVDFIKGRVIPNQLSPVKFYSYGIILEEIEKEIKPVWDYPPLVEQIYTKPRQFLRELKKLD